jgi:hypothetical protein
MQKSQSVFVTGMKMEPTEHTEDTERMPQSLPGGNGFLPRGNGDQTLWKLPPYPVEISFDMWKRFP